MTLQEFINQGYRIQAQVPVYQTHCINLKQLANSTDISNCEEEVINTYHNDDIGTFYDILDPDGNLISPYDHNAALRFTQDILDFIHKLDPKEYAK